MTLKNRLIKLEDRARPVEWPDMTLAIVSTDCRLNPTKPDEHLMTVHAGSPGCPGETVWHETTNNEV